MAVARLLSVRAQVHRLVQGALLSAAATSHKSGPAPHLHLVVSLLHVRRCSQVWVFHELGGKGYELQLTE